MPVAFLLACGVGFAATPPQESPIELLHQARARVVDTRRAGPVTLRYALSFPDGTAGTYVWRQRNRDNDREEITIGDRISARGVVSGKGWRTPGDDALEAWWLVSNLFAFEAQLTPEEGYALEATTQRVDGKEFVEVQARRSPEWGNWVVFLSPPTLDLWLSDIGFVRRSYADWKQLRGAGAVPGICRIYIEGALALEMTLERGTNKPIADSELAPPANAVDRPYCPDEISPPKLVKRTQPVYPKEARDARAHGLIVLSATIAADGEATHVRLVYPPGSTDGHRTLLVNAAIDAVKQWRYEPARCQGAPIDTDLVVTISFTLK